MINQISNFVDGMHLDSNHRRSGTIEETRRSSDYYGYSSRDPCQSRGRSRSHSHHRREDSYLRGSAREANEAAEHIVLQAEKFRAALAASKGKLPYQKLK